MYKLASVALALLSLSGSALGCSTVKGVKLTNYGYPDTPAPHQPAYKRHGGNPVPTQPGDKPGLGDGSFGNPYSAAAHATSTFKECQLLYVPIFKKYFKVSDHCSGSSKQANLYLMNINKKVGQLGCEQKFGILNLNGRHARHEVIVNPGKGFTTDTKALFANGKCYNKPSDGRVFPKRYGHVKCGGHNGDDAEVDTAEDFDGSTDTVDDSPSALNNEPAARRGGDSPMSTPTPEKKSVRDFRA